MKNYTVNERGMLEIANILIKHRKDGKEFAEDEEVLHAIAGEIEFQLDEGNPPCFELEAHTTLSGHTEEYEITDNGITVEHIEE